MYQGQGVKVHAEEAGNQVQRQKDGGQHGERAHDLVGAAALHAEVHLHCRFRALLQAAHMVHHALNVLQHITAAHLQQIALALACRGVRVGPGFQGLSPVLKGGPLVFADFVQVVQREPRFQQRAPVVETGFGVDQFRLPVVQLVGQFTA